MIFCVGAISLAKFLLKEGRSHLTVKTAFPFF